MFAGAAVLPTPNGTPQPRNDGCVIMMAMMMMTIKTVPRLSGGIRGLLLFILLLATTNVMFLVCAVNELSSPVLASVSSVIIAVACCGCSS